MSKVLVLKSSILGDNSVSTDLVDQFVAQLNDGNDGIEVSIRDLSLNPVPPLDQEKLTALMTDAAQRDARQQALVDYADRLITELQEADLLVIGAPMYNFTIPAGLKSWLDHVARAGVTFRYTENGPQGLLRNKQVVVVTSMGGHHLPGESDHLRPYLKTMLNFLGLEQISFVAAAGLNLGDGPRQQALQQAQQRLQEVVRQVAAALPGSDRERVAA
jgi:FMN-dependent NADH-azoreductase